MIWNPRLILLGWPLKGAKEKDTLRDSGPNTNDPKSAWIVVKAVVTSRARSNPERMHLLFAMIVELTTKFKIHTAGLFAIVCL